MDRRHFLKDSAGALAATGLAVTPGLALAAGQTAAADNLWLIAADGLPPHTAANLRNSEALRLLLSQGRHFPNAFRAATPALPSRQAWTSGLGRRAGGESVSPCRLSEDFLAARPRRHRRLGDDESAKTLFRAPAATPWIVATDLCEDDPCRATDRLERLTEAFRSSRADRRRTAIIFWGDGADRDHTPLWESLTRAELVIVAPGATPVSRHSHAVISALDIAPTAADLLGLPTSDLPGKSLRPLLRPNPAPWRGIARTDWAEGACSVRVNHWRYVRYSPNVEQLYDLRADPGQRVNVADRPALRDIRHRLALHATI